MGKFKIVFALILLLNMSFVSVFADTASQSQLGMSQTKSFPEQLLQQLILLLHSQSGYMPLEFSKKQIIEYSIIAAIVIIIIITIASSARSKNKKTVRK